MTPDAVTDRESFAEAWPVVAPVVHRTLLRKGIARETALDAVQESATRALVRLASGRGWTSRRGLLMWCHRVARNVVTDVWRTERRVVELDIEPVADDIAERCQWRMLLVDTLRALDGLRPAERDALLAYLAGDFPDDKRAQVRESVRRIRARERLRAVVGRLPVLWPGRRFRWLWTPVAGGVATCTLLATVALHVGTVPTTERVTASGTAPSEDRPSATRPPSLPGTAAVPSRGRAAPPGHRHPSRPSEAQTPSATPRDRQVVLTLSGPTGATEAGTVEDEGGHLACVETQAGQPTCVPKARRAVVELVEGLLVE